MSFTTHFDRGRFSPGGFALALFLAVLLAGCTSEDSWTQDQQAVYKAMQDWSDAVSRKDTEAMWEMLSPDAQDLYRRQRRFAIEETKRSLASLKSEHLPEVERKRIEGVLSQLPENPEEMSPQEFYAWHRRDDFSQEKVEAQIRHFDRSNIEAIEVKGGRATVKLIGGDEKRYSWVRHDGVWKFDLPPSKLRELEDARALESGDR